jgi:hypothetical protein
VKTIAVIGCLREECGGSPANEPKKKARVRKDGGEATEVEENRDERREGKRKRRKRRKRR